MFRRLLAVVSAAALALTLSTGPALAGGSPTLLSVMTELQPLQYWVLDDTNGPGQNQLEGQLPIAAYGTGPAVTWHTSSHPLGGFEQFSARLNADGRKSGQYLRSAVAPGSFGGPSDHTKPGSIVIWFRLPKRLPTWTQVLAVDNGAWSGTAGGLMISPTGRLVSEDASGFVDFRSKRTLNDGRWHCAVWTDTYRPDPDPAGSTLYLDGYRVSNSLVALWVPRLAVRGSRLLLGDAGAHEAKGIGRLIGNLSNVAIYEYPLSADDVGVIWSVGHYGAFPA